jgi:hypothetical protein
MTKEFYLEKLEEVKVKRASLDAFVDRLKTSYIEKNKPCNIGDYVRITLGSGRVVKGDVVSFGILSDKGVHISAYKEGSSTRFITVPTQNVEIITPK